VRRILRLADKSEDPLVLHGSLIALSGNPFLAEAEIETVCRMLRSILSHDQGGSSLFQSYNRFNQWEETEVSPESSEAPIIEFYRRESVATQAVAIQVCSNYARYPFNIVRAAATFLQKERPSSLDPLMELEADLGLNVAGPSSSGAGHSIHR